jgi:outer membrane protein
MRKMWKWILQMTIVLLVCLACLKGNAQNSPSPVGIKRAIEMALATNHSLKADSMGIVASGYQADILKASFRPQVSYSSKMEYNPAIPSQMLPGSLVGQPGKDLVPVRFGTRYGMGSTVEVTQNIIRNDIRSQMESAALDKKIAKTKYQLTKEELVYEVANSFYGLQASIELIRVTSSDLANLTKTLNIVKAQFDNGIVKRIDYESLQINVANKKSYLNQLQTQYNDQLAYFNYLIGVPADSQTIVDGHVSPVVGNVQQSREVLQREDVRLTRQLVESKQLEMKTIRAEGLPVISSYFRFTYQSQFDKPENALNNDYWNKSATVGISASVSLFDGHRRRTKLQAANAQLEGLRFDSEQQQRKARTEQVKAWETFTNDKEDYQITKNNLVLAEKVFASRTALYTEGVSTLIELLDAEQELSNSRNLHIQSLINVKGSMVNVHKANGTLLTEFLKSL